jgi:predicted DNA-binding antitoxin AbrB/MazE fold protein
LPDAETLAHNRQEVGQRASATPISKAAKYVVRTIRAKFVNGKIEPFENVELDEGEEVFVTLELDGKATSKKVLVRVAGA